MPISKVTRNVQTPSLRGASKWKDLHELIDGMNMGETVSFEVDTTPDPVKQAAAKYASDKPYRIQINVRQGVLYATKTQK